MQPIRIPNKLSGNVVLPDEPCHESVRLVRESLKALADLTPPDDERHTIWASLS